MNTLEIEKILHFIVGKKAFIFVRPKDLIGNIHVSRIKPTIVCINSDSSTSLNEYGHWLLLFITHENGKVKSIEFDSFGKDLSLYGINHPYHVVDRNIRQLQSHTSNHNTTLAITKSEDNYANFLNTVKASLALQGMHCDLIITFKEGKIVKIEIKFNPPTGYYMSVPFPLNRLLGLDFTELHPGNYEKDVDETYYDSYYKTIADGFVANITLICYDNTEIDLNQLKGHQTANTVINHIVEALDEHDVDISMILHPEKLAIEYEITPNTTRVVLSFLVLVKILSLLVLVQLKFRLNIFMMTKLTTIFSKTTFCDHLPKFWYCVI